jgi:hypothetical protein
MQDPSSSLSSDNFSKASLPSRAWTPNKKVVEQPKISLILPTIQPIPQLKVINTPSAETQNFLVPFKEHKLSEIAAPEPSNLKPKPLPKKYKRGIIFNPIAIFALILLGVTSFFILAEYNIVKLGDSYKPTVIYSKLFKKEEVKSEAKKDYTTCTETKKQNSSIASLKYCDQDKIVYFENGTADTVKTIIPKPLVESKAINSIPLNANSFTLLKLGKDTQSTGIIGSYIYSANIHPDSNSLAYMHITSLNLDGLTDIQRAKLLSLDAYTAKTSTWNEGVDDIFYFNTQSTKQELLGSLTPRFILDTTAGFKQAPVNGVIIRTIEGDKTILTLQLILKNGNDYILLNEKLPSYIYEQAVDLIGKNCDPKIIDCLYSVLTSNKEITTLIQETVDSLMTTFKIN